MKKLLLSMAAITMLFTSCSNEDLMSDVIGQGDAMVQFSLEVAETPQLKTQNGMLKSISDGKGANQLAYSVYDANGNIITALSSSASSFTFPGNVSLNLAKGQEYTVAFWAQNSACTAYNTADLKSVKIDYTGANNDETRDAFFKTVTFTVTESENIAIELTRPFAQINVGVTPEDWAAAKTAGVVVDQSKVKVTGVANEINLLTGDVKGTTDVEYTMATIPADTDTLKVDADKDGAKENYRYLSMSYILAPETTSGTGAAATTIDALEFEFQPISGSNIILKDGLVTVPVQRNWRTNIVGEILTGEINFNISIDSAYVENGDNNIAMKTLKVNGLAELEASLEANTAQKEAFVYNVEGLSGLSDVAIEIPTGTESEALIFDIIDVQNGAELSITGTDYAKQVIVKVPEGYNAGDLTVDIPGAHVILQQGTYTSVVASTSSTTLDITNGVTIKTLTVEAGNVRIAEGGAVESIINSKGSTLYIIAAGGVLPEEMPENTIVLYEKNTEKVFALNNMYSSDNISDVISYSKDILKENTINISLNKSAEVSTVNISNGQSVNLDLKGKTLSGVDRGTASYALLNNTGILTIKNGTLQLSAEQNRGWNAYSSVISNNPGGELTLESDVKVEHLGGTDMSYALDVLTNGKGTRSVATINGAELKSTYIGIRQFLNGQEAINELTVNSGSKIEGSKRGIWMQGPGVNVNSGKLTVAEGADINLLYISVAQNSTTMDIELEAAASSIKEVKCGYIPAGYALVEENGIYKLTDKIKVKDLAGLQEALQSDFIKILVEEQIAVQESLTLDLNGKTIECENNVELFKVLEGGELTLSNGNVKAYASVVWNDGGDVKILSGTYTQTGGALMKPSTYRYAIKTSAGGTTTVQGGTFYSQNGIFDAGANVIIDGGEFFNDMTTQAATRHMMYVSGSANVTINGGVFRGIANSGAGGEHICIATANAKVTIAGGKFTSLWTSGGTNAIISHYSSGSTVNITGGIFNTNKGITSYVTENTDDATNTEYPYMSK